jgi:phosphoribosyl 1,2-cyclic phosphodiesterase
VTILYAPDVVSIPTLRHAMRGLSLYVGGGAGVTRAIVRRRDGGRIGHASIRDQLDWCAAEGVRRAIFSHCGSEILRDEARARERVAALGGEQGIEAVIARDGLELTLR